MLKILLANFVKAYPAVTVESTTLATSGAGRSVGRERYAQYIIKNSE